MKRWLERRSRAHQLGAIASHALGCNRREGIRVMTSMLAANHRFLRHCKRIASDDAMRLPGVHWPGAEAFRTVIENDGRPLLLATLHLGNYLDHLLALAPTLAWLERVTLLRRLPNPALEDALLKRASRLGLQLQVAHTGQAAGRTALRTLRRGEHVLLLYDVPPSFGIGKTITTHLLGHPAAIPAGPALLCRAGNALLWPFCVIPEHRRLTLKCRDPFPVQSATEVTTATARLTGFAESTILQAPEHWLLWAHLPELWSGAQSDVQT